MTSVLKGNRREAQRGRRGSRRKGSLTSAQSAECCSDDKPCPREGLPNKTAEM